VYESDVSVMEIWHCSLLPFHHIHIVSTDYLDCCLWCTHYTVLEKKERL